MRFILFLFSFFFGNLIWAQEAVNPIIKQFGGIYDIESASVKPDPTLVYRVVVDLYSGSEDPSVLNAALNNVARMLNLHAIGGVHPDSLHVVLAIHGGATKCVLSNQDYRQRYSVDNPNLKLLDALSEAGVTLTVCGQSLIGRAIDVTEVSEAVQISTSMLTTVTTYQQRGYALLKF